MALSVKRKKARFQKFFLKKKGEVEKKKNIIYGISRL